MIRPAAASRIGTCGTATTSSWRRACTSTTSRPRTARPRSAGSLSSTSRREGDLMRNLARAGLGAVALAALLCAPAAAQTAQDNTGFGTSSAEFLLFGAGARGTALGGAVAALTTDVTALYYNPGDLAQMSRPGAMVSTYS